MRTLVNRLNAGRAAAATWIRQRLCGLHGHDELLALDGGRVALRCTSCGHETPGWDLAGLKPPVPVQPGIPRRHRIQRPRLTGIDWASQPDYTVEVQRKGTRTVAIRRRRAAG